MTTDPLWYEHLARALDACVTEIERLRERMAVLTAENDALGFEVEAARTSMSDQANIREEAQDQNAALRGEVAVLRTALAATTLAIEQIEPWLDWVPTTMLLDEEVEWAKWETMRNDARAAAGAARGVIGQMIWGVIPQHEPQK